MLLSIIQYFDTKADKTKAEEALAKANEYEVESRKVYAEVDSLRISAKEYQLLSMQTMARVDHVKNGVDTLSNQMNQVILSTLRNDWLQGNNSFFAMNPNSPEALKFVNNINSIVISILKDSTKVKVWWKETGAQLKR